MIETSMENFILWMIGVPLVTVAVALFFSGLRRRARARVLKRQILRCRICGSLYKDVSREKTVACPGCHSLNDKGPSRRLG